VRWQNTFEVGYYNILGAFFFIFFSSHNYSSVVVCMDPLPKSFFFPLQGDAPDAHHLHRRHFSVLVFRRKRPRPLWLRRHGHAVPLSGALVHILFAAQGKRDRGKVEQYSLMHELVLSFPYDLTKRWKKKFWRFVSFRCFAARLPQVCILCTVFPKVCFTSLSFFLPPLPCRSPPWPPGLPSSTRLGTAAGTSWETLTSAPTTKTTRR